MIKIVNPEHICVGAGHSIREVCNTQGWLRSAVPKHLVVTRSTRTREIIESMQMHYNVAVNQQAARLARAALINDRLEHQAQQFRQIPAYLARLRESNELCADLYTVDKGFQRVFICPAESRQSFLQMRRFMAVDGTFLKSRFIQTLLLAVGIDANGHNLLLAWAIVEAESTSSWEWFFHLLKVSIPECMEMTLISDRDKGLLAADQVLGGGVNRLICCFHLKCNFIKRYRGVEEHFWRIANAKSEAQYKEGMEELQRINKAAADYLAGVELSQWVTCYASGPTFGHKTSNVVESMNSTLRAERELSVLDLLNEIWHLTMAERFKRFERATELLKRKQKYTDFCLKHLNHSSKWAQKNVARVGDRLRAEVRQANDRVYVVDLERRWCDCGHFQENGIPCGHAFSFINALGESPRSYVPDHLTVAGWERTYRTNMRPVNIEDLALAADCNPPTKRRALAGRPRTLRLTAGSRQKRIAQAQASLNDEPAPVERGFGSQACRLCGGYGHNRRTCTQSCK